MSILKKVLFFALPILMFSCAKPIANFTYQQAEGKKAPSNVTIENNSQKADAYEWSFGDGTISTEAKPTHRYKTSGTYTIQLKAKKGNKVAMTEQKITIDAPHECLVELETELGTMLIELSNETPQHRDNFLKLAEQGFYDGTLFHRVINGFMVQGGDPDSKTAKDGQPLGAGDLGYTVPAEFTDSLVHIKGALCAARTGDQVNPKKRSSASQFYLVQGRLVDDKTLDYMESVKGFHYTKEQREAYKTLGGTPFLDKDYTVYGRVVKGMEIIDKIANTETLPGDRPKKDLKMKVKVIK
jgi:cyclophilin family peptidyl-prolyl cis-trans isomerase